MKCFNAFHKKKTINSSKKSCNAATYVLIKGEYHAKQNTFCFKIDLLWQQLCISQNVWIQSTEAAHGRRLQKHIQSNFISFTLYIYIFGRSDDESNKYEHMQYISYHACVSIHLNIYIIYVWVVVCI